MWLRLVLAERYPEAFGPEYTPKTLEVVANRAREPEDADAFYQRLLTACWREAARILKPGGILAFTFHHSEDAPWVAVLESLFDAGFYLEQTYPIRSDETKGTGEFGSKKIEFDIIHVCRKKRGEPERISWAKLRQQVLSEVRRLKDLLEHHPREGLSDADLRVILRGKCLEAYSRHYDQVYLDDQVQPMGVAEALLGINQLLDEESGTVSDPPPAEAEPHTRQFLRMFREAVALPRDQVQKLLKGTGTSPAEYVERGWCAEEKKVYHLIEPLDLARRWQPEPVKKLVRDYDQAGFILGACMEGSGIRATEVLEHADFKPHPALGALLEWFAGRGATDGVRSAAARAERLLKSWRSARKASAVQPSLFPEGGA